WPWRVSGAASSKSRNSFLMDSRRPALQGGRVKSATVVVNNSRLPREERKREKGKTELNSHRAVSGVLQAHRHVLGTVGAAPGRQRRSRADIEKSDPYHAGGGWLSRGPAIR